MKSQAGADGNPSILSLGEACLVTGAQTVLKEREPGLKTPIGDVGGVYAVKTQQQIAEVVGHVHVKRIDLLNICDPPQDHSRWLVRSLAILVYGAATSLARCIASKLCEPDRHFPTFDSNLRKVRPTQRGRELLFVIPPLPGGDLERREELICGQTSNALCFGDLFGIDGTPKVRRP